MTTMHRGRVEAAIPLTPHMTRIALGGPGLDDLTPSELTDSYVNIALPRPDDPDGAPARRRYTVRALDAAERLLTIDFVVHGDVGVAGRWATHARPGDELAFTGPSGAYSPDPDASWHLMAGDESALPAIAASLTAVPPGVPVIALLVGDGPDDKMQLDTPGDLDLRWLHRTGDVDHDEQLLARAVGDLVFPGGAVCGFVHGEAAELRAVRRHLLGERCIDRSQLWLSPCWRRHMTDEAWRQINSAWNADVEQDVA